MGLCAGREARSCFDQETGARCQGYGESGEARRILLSLPNERERVAGRVDARETSIGVGMRE